MSRLSKQLEREASFAELARHLKSSVEVLRQTLDAGERARERLMAANMRLVVSVAKKYTRHGVMISDLITVGPLALAVPFFHAECWSFSSLPNVGVLPFCELFKCLSGSARPAFGEMWSECLVQLFLLMQAGTVGLSKGVERFDPSRGFKLSTYVHWWIRQVVKMIFLINRKRIPLVVAPSFLLAALSLRVPGAGCDFLPDTSVVV